MKEVTILVDGEPPEHPVALASFLAADYLVCTDGAYNGAVGLGREPELVVGDGDSLSREDRESLGERWVGIAEQDTNDLDKAFRTVLEKFPDVEKIVIVGGGGKREDHFLGNLFRLPGFLRRAPGVEIEMVTNAGVFKVCRGEKKFDSKPRDPVSVFAPEPGTEIESVGLEWPLDGLSLTEIWMGTLNRTTGESFTLKSNAPILVYLPFMV